jgi:hypothetical protein
MTILNILHAAIFEGIFFTMLHKVWVRFFDKRSSISIEDNLRWLMENESSLAGFCSKLDCKLWREIQDDVNRISICANKTLQNIPFDLGGGGAYPLLYFITRYNKPAVVVETGVASGFSTFSILDALSKNQKGHLYSSDLPYFRLPNPTQYIGIVVPDVLKSRWSLYTKGDHLNLKNVCACIRHIDVFHYDSDKSYKGRAMVFSFLRDYLSNKSWVIMDDIQDDSFFYDFASEIPEENWRVFNFQGKWLGLIVPR